MIPDDRGPIMVRSTINARPPHTMRDAARDPYDWLAHVTPQEPPDPARWVALAILVGLLVVEVASRVWS